MSPLDGSRTMGVITHLIVMDLRTGVHARIETTVTDPPMTWGVQIMIAAKLHLLILR